MDSRAVPISANERILTIDVVRGLALLGIFIMNMPWFTTSFFVEADGSHLWPEDGRDGSRREPLLAEAACHGTDGVPVEAPDLRASFNARHGPAGTEHGVTR
ncbi:MAG TPA: hypothetical protein VEZ88_08525 [Steroidobacteraceae bacterium]|nr:hypothetical protein [Steroidobacteraceae bacterium]